MARKWTREDRRRSRSSYEQCRASIQKIKVDFLDAYDSVVEDGLEPTMSRIRGQIPYMINGRFANELRRELVESGDLPEPRRGGISRKAIPVEDKKIVYYCDRKEIMKKTEEIRIEAAMKDGCLPDNSDRHRQEMAAIATLERMRRTIPPWQLEPEQMTNTDVCKWAIKSFWAAWRSIRELAHRDPKVASDEPEHASQDPVVETLQAETTRPRYDRGLLNALSRSASQSLQAPG